MEPRGRQVLSFLVLSCFLISKVAAFRVEEGDEGKQRKEKSKFYEKWSTIKISTTKKSTSAFGSFDGRHDTQHNDIQHNDIQHNDIQHNDIQHTDNQHNDPQHNGIQQNDIQHNDIHHNDTQHNDIQHKRHSE